MSGLLITLIVVWSIAGGIVFLTAAFYFYRMIFRFISKNYRLWEEKEKLQIELLKTKLKNRKKNNV